MSELVRKIKFAREGAGVKRCHTVPIIGEYLVGYHSFNILSMLRIWKPNASLALVWAIVEHDIPERLTGDVPAPAKWAGVTNRNKLDLLEQEINEDIFGEDNRGNLSTEEVKWLKALDILELYLWCRDQVELGNRNTLSMMKRIENYVNKNKVNWPNEFNENWADFQHTNWIPIPELGDDK